MHDAMLRVGGLHINSGSGSQPQMTTIAVGAEQSEMLTKVAAEQGTTVEAVLGEALEQYIRENE